MKTIDQDGLAAPFIVRQLKDHNSVSYKVVCEVLFNATKNAKKSALMLILVYYTFNIKYQNYYCLLY